MGFWLVMDTRKIQLGWYETHAGVKLNCRTTAGITVENATHCTSAGTLMHDLAAVGWNNIQDISPDLASVTFNLGGIVFSISVGQQYPRERPVLTAGAFPDQLYPWSPHDGFQHLCKLYTASIVKHQLYFQV